MLNRQKLYGGLVRNGKWYNYYELKPLLGGALVLLEGMDNSGAARILNLMKASFDTLYSEDGSEYKVTAQDYMKVKVADTWKIGYDQIKAFLKTDYPIIPEHFYCPVCSSLRNEHYTKVEESWQELFDKGYIDEFYMKSPEEETFEVTLPSPIVVEPNKTVAGGTFDTLIMTHITIGDTLSIQKNSVAMESKANTTYAVWDSQIVGIVGMSERDFNIVKRSGSPFFSKKYICTSGENEDAMIQAGKDNLLGWDASQRKVPCVHCNSEIGGSLDFTNFFSVLLKRR